jgi:hypothetical protein
MGLSSSEERFSKWRWKMTRYTFLVLAALMLWSSVPAPLYGFGPATHAYLARQVGDQQGPASLPEIYGAVLPDVFNLVFGDTYQTELATRTHYEFMKLVEQAQSAEDKALAFGFASHNESWGADWTAHISSTADPNDGYVIAKADELAALLAPKVRLFLLFSGVPNSSAVVEEVLPLVAHSAVETAIDLLIAQNEDPDIGERLVWAARTRGWSAPLLLGKAYAADLAAMAGTTEAVAAPLIIAAESEFRLQVESYGAALSEEDPLDALTQQGAEIAKLLLAAEQGIILDIPADLMKEILNAALDVVRDDYAAQLAATVTRVRQELESHGIARPAQ